MKLETAQEILEYLDKYGPTNTFRVSRDLKIERKKLINLINELANKRLIKFKSGVVTKGDKQLANQEIIKKELREEKLAELPKIQHVPETTKKSKISDYSKLEEVKKEIQKLENKEEKLKKEIEDLQTQRKGIALKLAEERERLDQVQKEREDTEKNLEFINQKEEALKKREKSVSAAFKKLKEDRELLGKDQENIAKKVDEAIGLEKEKLAKLRKILKKEKESISKAKVLKKNINKLEITLEDLKKKINEEKGKLEKLKKKEAKAKLIPKKIVKPIKEIKPVLKPEIEKLIDKMGVSKIETKEPKITPKELWQPAEEVGKEKIEDKVHDLIEEEISLLKQKRICEARNVHFQIIDMISGITDPQRKTIIKDWSRVRELY